MENYDVTKDKGILKTTLDSFVGYAAQRMLHLKLKEFDRKQALERMEFMIPPVYSLGDFRGEFTAQRIKLQQLDFDLMGLKAEMDGWDTRIADIRRQLEALERES